jgi:hypothetical protein
MAALVLETSAALAWMQPQPANLCRLLHLRHAATALLVLGAA